MIDYDAGTWHVLFAFACEGSVLPRAAAWALPASLLALAINLWNVHSWSSNISQAWASYNFVLGFVLVFRSQQAISRFWEGATILLQVRGEWLNAVSSCFAFTNKDPAKQEQVERFRHTTIRLMSLLYCSALQQVAVCEDEAFEVIDVSGFSLESLHYLADCQDKCLVILQWMQHLIVAAQSEGTINIAPPILSRVFQELSRGIVGVTDAQKISDIAFPFPFAQLVSVMLLLMTFVTPCVTGLMLDSPFLSCTTTFVSVTALWSLNYMSAEIEMPFGDDPNDLPLGRFQEGLNDALLALVGHLTLQPPSFTFDPDVDRFCATQPCPAFLVNGMQYSAFTTTPRTTIRSAKTNEEPPDHQNHQRSIRTDVGSPSPPSADSNGMSVLPGTFPLLVKMDPFAEVGGSADPNVGSTAETPSPPTTIVVVPNELPRPLTGIVAVSTEAPSSPPDIMVASAETPSTAAEAAASLLPVEASTVTRVSAKRTILWRPSLVSAAAVADSAGCGSSSSFQPGGRRGDETIMMLAGERQAGTEMLPTDSQLS